MTATHVITADGTVHAAAPGPEGSPTVCGAPGPVFVTEDRVTCTDCARAVRTAVAGLARIMDDSEAREQHAVLIFDPDTGRRHVIGPYPDRLTARVARLLIEQRNLAADPEFANLTYEVVLSYPPEDQ